MFPLSDDNSDQRLTPFINFFIVALNIAVFVLFQQLGGNPDFDHAFSAVPKEILSGKDVVGTVHISNSPGSSLHLEPTPIPVYFTLLTSMFMHGGFAHIGGNMLYLWIFGDNLEQAMGHMRYLAFYLICGIIAGLSHVFATALMGANLYIPCLGASGAISGVMGGYIMLFPHRRVTVLMFRQLMDVPAYVALGSWILFQLIDSLGYLGSSSDGVAYAAHIGGFIAGVALVHFFKDKDYRPGNLY